jgi:hypothetical protein
LIEEIAVVEARLRNPSETAGIVGSRNQPTSFSLHKPSVSNCKFCLFMLRQIGFSCYPETTIPPSYQQK